MASHQLIDAYLAVLGDRLPADTVDELADGLTETWQRHLAGGARPAEAARAAIAEFGTTQQVTTAFVAQAPGRRTALALLATGPAVGVCWGASLVTAHAWTWSVPAAAVAGYALALLAAIGCLIAAATARRDYRRTRLGQTGGLVLVALDAAMLAAVGLFAATFAWPMLAAVPASLVRIGLTLRALPRVLTL